MIDRCMVARCMVALKCSDRCMVALKCSDRCMVALKCRVCYCSWMTTMVTLPAVWQTTVANYRVL